MFDSNSNRRSFIKPFLMGSALIAGAIFHAQRRKKKIVEDKKALSEFWNLSLKQVDTTYLLDLAQFRGEPLIVNFWASWCPPCIAEMPLLEAFYRKNHANGMQLVALAIDEPDAVKAFLEKKPVTFPVGLAKEQSFDLNLALGNERGTIPFSVLIDANGRILERKIGMLQSENLNEWLSLVKKT